jgi:hypothetical protein
MGCHVLLRLFRHGARVGQHSHKHKHVPPKSISIGHNIFGYIFPRLVVLVGLV